MKSGEHIVGNARGKLSDTQHRYSITSSAVASSSRGKASHARVGYFA
jgi:hypothetical protein